MTANVPMIHPSRQDGAPPILPSPVERHLDGGYCGEWDSVRALARIKADGAHSQIPQLAAQMMEACVPIQREKLIQRLTALGMTMAPNRPAAEATVWVSETARLLSGYASDILLAAIDAHQLESKFLPTVAEIRERAEPAMERRRREAARLDAMARLIASGQPVPELPKPEPPKPRPPEQPMTPEQVEEMNDIMARVGASTRYRPDGSRYEAETHSSRGELRGPLRKPTREDYIALGVDPAILDSMETPA